MMAIFFMLFCLTFAWWCVLWFAVGVDFAALTTPAIVLLHVAPPLLAVMLLVSARSAWKWKTAKRERERTADIDRQEEAKRKAEDETKEAEIAKRRAFVECRAAWLTVTDSPEWFTGELDQSEIIVEDVDALDDLHRETVLSLSLRKLFEMALTQCKALAYLPLYLMYGHEDVAIAREVWQEALTAAFPDDAPTPDFRLFPDAAEPLTDRIIAMFENDPEMPAIWLIGMDSLLEGMTGSSAPEIKPGHAVAALILSRPSLVLDESDTIEEREADPHRPFWEQEHGYRQAPQWGSVPPAMRGVLLEMTPLTTLHRSRALNLQEITRPIIMSQRLHAVIQNALIDAGLLDLPGGAETKEPEPLDLGFMVHNAGADSDPITGQRLASVVAALNDFECPMDVDLSANVLAEHGDTGTACPTVMLAEAAISAAQAQLPVMVAGWVGAQRLDIGFVLPSGWLEF